MSTDLLKRAKTLEKRDQLKKFKKVLPIIVILSIFLLIFLPGKSQVIYATVESPPAISGSQGKYTQFKAKLNNKEIVTVKSKDLLNLSAGDRIKINRTVSILFKIKRYSFYSKIYP